MVCLVTAAVRVHATGAKLDSYATICNLKTGIHRHISHRVHILVCYHERVPCMCNAVILHVEGPITGISRAEDGFDLKIEIDAVDFHFMYAPIAHLPRRIFREPKFHPHTMHIHYIPYQHVPPAMVIAQSMSVSLRFEAIRCTAATYFNAKPCYSKST
jgi:hypothetical protein